VVIEQCRKGRMQDKLLERKVWWRKVAECHEANRGGAGGVGDGAGKRRGKPRQGGRNQRGSLEAEGGAF